MNSISLFLYLSGIVGNVQGTLVCVLIFGGLFTVVPSVIGYFVIICSSYQPDPDKLLAEKLWSYLKVARWLFPLMLVVCVLLPSRETMYAIAGSQVAEQIVQNKDVQGVASDALTLLRQYIQAQIQPPAKKD